MHRYVKFGKAQKMRTRILTKSKTLTSCNIRGRLLSKPVNHQCTRRAKWKGLMMGSGREKERGRAVQYSAPLLRDCRKLDTHLFASPFERWGHILAWFFVDSHTTSSREGKRGKRGRRAAESEFRLIHLPYQSNGCCWPDLFFCGLLPYPSCVLRLLAFILSPSVLQCVYAIYVQLSSCRYSFSVSIIFTRSTWNISPQI